MEAPIRSKRVYEEVAERIAQLIKNAELQSGDRLPAERDLARRFSVSRPSVREAIIALETAGLVEVRAGEAAYVAARRLEEISLPLASLAAGAWEQMEAGELFETQLARNAAGRGETPARKRVEAVLTGPGGAGHTSGVPAPLTWSFHRAVIEAGDNAFMASLADELWRYRTGKSWTGYETGFARFDADPALTFDRFRLAEAIVGGSQRDAAASMGRLYLRMRTILFD
jgi:DNA-binding FadR family transcriptional regulator